MRIVNLAQQPLWADEVLSLDISTYLQPREIIKYLAAVEVHPPLYYLFLHFWTDWFGATNFMVKVPSLVFGLACIVATYYFGRSLFRSEKIALLAAFIIAVMPFQIEFSQEARPYIIYCFFGIIAAISIWKYYETQKSVHQFFYIAANIIGLYLHYSYVLILLPLASWSFIQIYLSKNRSRSFLIWLSVHTAVFLGFSFWLIPFLFKTIVGGSTIYGWTRSYYFIRESDFFPALISQFVWLTKEGSLPQIQLLVAFIAQILFMFAAGWVIKNKSYSRTDLKPAGFLVCLFLSGTILFFAVPQSVSYKILFQSHAIFISVILALLVAWVLASLPKKSGAVIFIIFVLSLIPYDSGILGNDSFWDQDYNLEAGGQFINENFRVGDIVIVSVGFIRTDLTHYLDDGIPVYEILPINYYGLDEYSSRHTLGFVENEFQSRFTIPSEGETESKISNLDKINRPGRVWLYGFSESDFTVHHWFNHRNWRHVYRNLGNVLRVDLYERPTK
ncbi:MAG: glycosyltransferase family 39 protein [Candidatus Doudnabacteria bacterium]|nr:glycosyltransferase family 39 protein [Candidatus Doudnabacteria bacterium]